MVMGRHLSSTWGEPWPFKVYQTIWEDCVSIDARVESGCMALAEIAPGSEKVCLALHERHAFIVSGRFEYCKMIGRESLSRTPRLPPPPSPASPPPLISKEPCANTQHT